MKTVNQNILYVYMTCIRFQFLVWLTNSFRKTYFLTSPTGSTVRRKERRTVRRRWPSKDFDDRPADRHVISSNSAFVKCCFRERGAEGVGSDFPPACLWSVFVSRFEATWPTCCDRKGINSASRQNKRKEEKKKPSKEDDVKNY